MSISESWYRHLCAELDLTPDDWLWQWFSHWARWEATPEWIWNPLATTEPAPDLRSDRDIGFGPGRWNNANPPYGVGIYRDAQAGAKATARTLKNGYYPTILESLSQRRITNRDAVVRELRTWGTTGFANQVESGWAPVPRPAGGSDEQSGQVPPGAVPSNAEIWDYVLRLEARVAQALDALIEGATVARATVED